MKKKPLFRVYSWFDLQEIQDQFVLVDHEWINKKKTQLQQTETV